MSKPIRLALVVLGLALAVYGTASLTGGWLGTPPWQREDAGAVKPHGGAGVQLGHRDPVHDETEHERLMRSLLAKAKPVEDARQRDPEMIKRLVDRSLSGDIDVRRRANRELAARSGDYAVPCLLPALGDADVEKVVNAIFALQYIGSEAVQPLCAALGSPDARLRSYICAVLGDLKDKRALPYLRRAAEKDADEGVRVKANAAINKVDPGASAESPAESFVRVGNLYYDRDAAVLGEVGEAENLWRWQSGALVREEVTGAVLPYRLARIHAEEALALEGEHAGARLLLARSIEAQVPRTQAHGAAPEWIWGAVIVVGIGLAVFGAWPPRRLRAEP